VRRRRYNREVGVIFEQRTSMFRWMRVALVTSVVSVFVLATVPAPAPAAPRVRATARFMPYNVYLGANLQPLFTAPDLPELIRRAAAIFAHLDLVDFNVRAVAIAQQIIEQEPDVVSLQEVSLWQTSPTTTPGELTTKYDFLTILLTELERRGHPYRAVSVSDNFRGTLPIDFVGTLGTYTDRNALIVRADVPASELSTSNPMNGVFGTALPVSLAGTPILVTRGWASADVTIRTNTYRIFDTHFEAFSNQVRLGQVGELARIMSSSPHPTVLAGDVNLFPRGVREIDRDGWDLLKDEGFRDAWIVAECFEPRFTAGQTDDLDNAPSNLDNTVDYVLFDKDFEAQPVEGACDIAGEELDDRTDTTPALWPSDHAAVVVEMHIPKP
jgi:endonuclease/exonuclease/phosphatase family metal-dependent hydrolase